MTGYCRAGDMYVDWPCPAKACPGYDNCLKQYDSLVSEGEQGKTMGYWYYDPVRGRRVGKIDPNQAMALYKQGLNDVQIGERVGVSDTCICKWRRDNNLPVNKKKKSVLTNDPKQCNDCGYWRTAGCGAAAESIRFCHHLLDTGSCRKRDENKCLSYKKREKRGK